MKRFLKILTFIILCNFSILSVKAEDKCESLKMYAQSDFWTKPTIYMNYGTVNLSYSMYTLKDSSSAAFTSYCRNAGISAGKSYNGETFYCDHTVFDSTSDDETVKAYDAGIIAILKNGYGTKNPSYNALEPTKGNAATNVALRVYEMLWPNLNTNGNNNTGSNNAHKYYVNLWLDDPNIQSLLKESVGSVRAKFTNATTVKSWTDGNGTVITDQIVGEAKRLLILGLEASRYYRQNGAASLKGIDNKPLKTKEPVVTDRNGQKTYKTSLTYTFEADKFKSSNAYIKIGFTCANCSTYGVDYTIYVNDQNLGKNTSQINLMSFLNNGTGTIEYRIEFTATSDTYQCEQLDYKLEIEYFDETISVEAYDMYSSGCTSNTSCQHFYMLFAKDVPTKNTIDSSIELCTLTCQELKKSCEEGNSEACSRFNEEYGGDCAECTTYINNAACSENDSNIDLNEGYDVDTANCGSVSDDSLNVLQCVINNEDPAGNSYKATTSNFSNTINNKYCSVWCKEDYHFVLPGIKAVNSGRYFSLQASIKGSKTCYTSKIDKDGTFKDDLEVKRKAVIDAWNEWNKWYQGLNGSYSDLDNSHTARNRRCKAGYWDSYDCSYTNANGETVDRTCSTYVCTDRCDCSVEYDGYKRNWTYQTYDYNGGTGNKSYTDTRDGGYASCACHSGSGKDGTVANIVSAINGDLTTATRSLKAAIKAYTDLLNQYNSCSGINTVSYNLNLVSSDVTGWRMDYEFDPIISFWYQESYMNSVLTDELETVGSVSIGGFKQSFCTSDTNNSYEDCSSGWQTSLNKSDTTSQFVCKKNGSVYTCGTESMIISKAKYVKQEMTSSGEYITPTQFYTIYPTGAIVVSEEGNSDNIENSKELTNLLPVGLGTTQGVYTYVLKVKDLGEYYNKEKLGRLWGDSNSVVVNVLDDENTCTKEGALQENVKVNQTTLSNGVYVCAYKVNCPDCPVECEENGCYNPDCPDGNCPVVCTNCIYTNNETNVSYRPITPSDINPNDRKLGVNWKYDENSISTALELKAYATTKEIEEAGESIYDINFENSTSILDTEFAMKVKLDSTMINKIREYNDKYENNGGYANNTLKCYDYVNSTDGQTYENIYCYSTFIDELLYDNKTKNNISIIGNRIIGTDEQNTDTLRKSQTQNSGYWTTWTEANSSKWTITTQNGLAYYKSNYGEIGIGPSWK